ncbi:MAG TPA: hypothetical protein VHF90_10220 [Thermoleophilaceae bacterium]|nr:hypothetical protein [Thermoleophilaceae bacterium]
MFRTIRTHLNPASLIAMVALFAALGGVSYAAATIDGKDIKNGTVTGKKLKQGTITGSKVKADSLGGPKIKESTLGQVPSAANAQQAQEAVNAQTAVSAQSATNADNAQTAVTADSATTAQTAVSAQTAATVEPNGVARTALQNDAVNASKLAATTRRTAVASIPAGGTALVEANCAAGEQLLSGGGVWSGAIGAAAVNLHVVHSFPGTGGDWSTRVYNGTAAARDFTAYALCLSN